MPRWLLAALGAASLWSGAAQAGIVTYDFSDAPLGAQTPLTLTEQGLAVTFAGAADPAAGSGDPSGSFEVSYNTAGTLPATYATFSGAFLTVGEAFGAAGSPLTITFSSAIRSISLLFALDDPANASLLTMTAGNGLTVSGGGTIVPTYSYPEGSLTLAGDPFSSVTLSSTALDFSIDGIVVDTPEPGSLVLALGFLPALLLLRRRPRGV